MGLDIGVFAHVYASYRDGNCKNSEGEFEPVSTGYFNEIALDTCRRTRNFRLAQTMHEASGIEILSCPRPRPSTWVVERTEHLTKYQAKLFGLLRQAVKWGDAESLSNSCASATASLAGEGFVFVDQPAETMESFVFTKPEFAEGARRLAELQLAEDDGTHMNAQYGAAMLQKLLARARNGAPPL